MSFSAVVVATLAVLAISFVAVGVGWREPRLRAHDGMVLPRGVATVLDSPVTRWVGRAVVLALTLWVLVALVLGADTARNPVAGVVYVWFWVGLAFASMLFGAVWRVVNPLRLVHGGLLRVAGLDPDVAALRYRAGWWPAAAGLFAFTWMELVAEGSTTLGFLRLAVVAYVAVTLVGSLLFGRVWFDRADPFEAWSTLLGRLSPLGRRDDGRWVLRTPLHGVALLAGERGLVATVSVMLGSTAYDGFSADLRWATFVQTSPVPPGALRTATLLAFCVLVAAMLGLAAVASVRLARRPLGDAPPFASTMASSLIPVAAGYVVAHYWSLFVYQGQVTLTLLSNPFGDGRDLLGFGGLQPDTTLIAPTLVATVQATSIVVGHLLGVLVAHERAITVLDRRSAVVGQVPLMLLMLAYTLGGLTLLFTP